MAIPLLRPAVTLLPGWILSVALLGPAMPLLSIRLWSLPTRPAISLSWSALARRILSVALARWSSPGVPLLVSSRALRLTVTLSVRGSTTRRVSAAGSRMLHALLLGWVAAVVARASLLVVVAAEELLGSFAEHAVHDCW